MSKDAAIICLIGHKNSGKSTTALLLSEQRRIAEVAFADKMKQIVELVFPEDPLMKHRLYGPSSRREMPFGYRRDDGTYPTAREALTTLGDWGRALQPLLWTDLTIHDALQAAQRRTARFLWSKPQYVVITDGRFIREAKAVKRVGGYNIRISRYETDSKVDKSHNSEQEQYHPEMEPLIDYTIHNPNNDHFTEDLADQIRNIIKAIEAKRE